MHHLPPDFQQSTVPDLNSLRKLYLDRQPIKYTTLKTCGISPLVFDAVEEPTFPRSTQQATHSENKE